MDRAAEIATIESFIAARGVTLCPTRFVANVPGALPPAEAAARLAAIEVRERTREQSLKARRSNHSAFFRSLLRAGR